MSDIISKTDRFNGVHSIFPIEIYIEILKYVNVKDIIAFSLVSKAHHKILSNDISSIIYEMLNNNVDSMCRKYVNSNLFYIDYHRGKSYPDYDSSNKDILFELGDLEHILFHEEIKAYTGKADYLIVTLDVNLNYNVYCFSPEVDFDAEYTPEYHGWDNDDIDIMVLIESYKYDNIKSINIPEGSFRSYYHDIDMQEITHMIHKKILMYPYNY
jgi:hypothetical protein